MNALPLLLVLTVPHTLAATPCPDLPKAQQTPCMPSREKLDEVLSLIDETIKYHDEWRKAQGEERKLRNALKKGRSIDYAAWEQSLAAIRTARKDLDASFEKASTSAEKNFHVGPHSRNGNIHGGLFNDGRTHWNPILGTEETFF